MTYGPYVNFSKIKWKEREFSKRFFATMQEMFFFLFHSLTITTSITDGFFIVCIIIFMFKESSHQQHTLMTTISFCGTVIIQLLWEFLSPVSNCNYLNDSASIHVFDELETPPQNI